MQEKLKQKAYLIITASGGSGIIQAAKAQEQRIKQEDPNAKVIIKDLMLEWLGGLIGTFGVNAWNKAQKKGRVRYQGLLVSFQRLAEIIFWPQIFYFVFRTLIKEDIDYVIDAQPLGTSATIKAIRIFNKISKKNLRLKKIFVDLPSKKCTHYYNNIKRLSHRDKKFVFISTIEPHLEKGETSETFWRKYCKISTDRICYESYPIRLSFDKYIGKELIKEDYFVQIKYENENDASIIEKVMKKNELDIKKENSFFKIKIGPNDFVITILLGSQPAFRGTLGYVLNMISYLNKNRQVKKNIKIFAYCSSSKDKLIEKMYKKISQIHNYPTNLHLIPMTFQPEEVIASLYFRSDMTITRSGGQTAVELMKVSKAKICVHSEYRSNNPNPFDDKKLLRGIPCWESGSASYMRDKMDASIINPDSFIEICKELIID